MRAWLLAHARAIGDAGRRLRAQPLSAALSVFVIGIALSLPIGLSQVLAQVQGFAARFTSNPQVSVFLLQTAESGERQSVEEKLLAHSAAKRVHFIGRDAALQDLSRSAGLRDVLEVLETNPLPDAFVVDVAGGAGAVEQLQKDAAGWAGVEHVQSDTAWAQRLEALLGLARTVVVLVATMLASGLVAITFNTIRLQILGRRAEIEVAQLIGATDGFVRRPFLYFGFLQGLLGAIIAWTLVAIMAAAIGQELTVLNRLYGSAIRFGLPSMGVVLGVSAVCALLGALGAALSVQDYLRRGRAK